jgi:RNA-binding protein YhbY
MMFAYLNSNKHPVETIQLEELEPQLKELVWGDWSPMTVLEKMDAKKYSENAERIKKADLSYPIIVTGKHRVVDGFHRLAKAQLEGKKTIKVQVFDAALMRKFLLVKGLDFVKLNEMKIHEVLELYIKRFC